MPSSRNDIPIAVISAASRGELRSLRYATRSIEHAGQSREDHRDRDHDAQRRDQSEETMRGGEAVEREMQLVGQADDEIA